MATNAETSARAQPERFLPERIIGVVSAARSRHLMGGAGIPPPRIGGVHLRRALLLFAIVLGLAAIAASVSRPRNGANRLDPLRAPTTTQPKRAPTASPEANGPLPAIELTFVAGHPHRQRIRAGQAATVFVKVDKAGQAQIADLRMSAVAEPLTPGRFDVLTSKAGRYPVTFTPAGAADAQIEAGTLVVSPAGG
jgi:hypothetical protein